MLPNHIETVERLLAAADFCHTLVSLVLPRQESFRLASELDLSDASDRHWLLTSPSRAQHGIPLSFAAHRLDMYRRLPYGWRTTPENTFTDLYMWEQFLAHSECRAVSGMVPTILYFPRYSRTEWSVQEKLEELKHWSERIKLASWNSWFFPAIINGLAQDRVAKARQLRIYSKPLARLRIAYWNLRESIGKRE
jgi:hypothetical protein